MILSDCKAFYVYQKNFSRSSHGAKLIADEMLEKIGEIENEIKNERNA